jgi:hypothetical protein
MASPAKVVPANFGLVQQPAPLALQTMPTTTEASQETTIQQPALLQRFKTYLKALWEVFCTNLTPKDKPTNSETSLASKA